MAPVQVESKDSGRALMDMMMQLMACIDKLENTYKITICKKGFDGAETSRSGFYSGTENGGVFPLWTGRTFCSGMCPF